MVKTDQRLSIYLRIALVSILIALLGVSPVPQAVSTAMKEAQRAIDAGDWSSAATDLANAAEFYPDRADLVIKAAHYAFQAGDPKTTIQYLERNGIYKQLTPEDLILLGDAYYQSGNTAEAEATWKSVVAKGDSTEATHRLADLYLEQKDYISAVDQLQKLLSLNPSDVSLYYQIGLLYAVTDPLKALPFLAQAGEIDPSTASNSRELHDKIRTASLFDQPAYTLLASGRQLANIGDWAYAAEAFRHATELDPAYADAWAFLGEAQQQIGMAETGSTSKAGLSELRRALQVDGNSTLGNTFMGLYWERQQDYSQAKYYLEQAIATNPSDPYLFTEMGNILSKAGDLPAAQSAYEAAIKLAPQEPLFQRLLAEYALENQIQIRELALPAARQAIMLNPHDPASLDLMAKVMLELQDYHSAKNYAEEALNFDPGFAPAYLHLGTAYLYLNEPGLALQWLDKARKIEPDSWVGAQAARMIDYYFK
jgi:tetratricopeptide (TPR) repeat protein